MQDMFVNMVTKIVDKILEKRGLLANEWHMGKIDKVNPNGTLDVFIDGSLYATPSVPANPQVRFEVGDYVWVNFINRNPNNLFVMSKRFVDGVQFNDGTDLYASVDHKHDNLYAPVGHNHDGQYSLSNHNHDSVYVKTDDFRLTKVDFGGSPNPLVVYSNLAGYTFDNSASAGAFVITTNIPKLSNTMFKIELDGYFYDNTAPFVMHIGGYAYTTGSVAYKGYVNLGNNRLAVRVGREVSTGKLIIILGDESSSYRYPKIFVKSLLVAYTGARISTLAQGWTITQETDLSKYDQIETVPDVGYRTP